MCSGIRCVLWAGAAQLCWLWALQAPWMCLGPSFSAVLKIGPVPLETCVSLATAKCAGSDDGAGVRGEQSELSLPTCWR